MMKIELRKMDEPEYNYINDSLISELKEEFIAEGKSFQEVSTNFKNSTYVH